MDRSPHIRTGGAGNLLQVICIWDDISLHVNGWHLITVYDDAFDGGEVGLTVGTSDDPGSAKVAFDSFQVGESWE